MTYILHIVLYTWIFIQVSMFFYDTYIHVHEKVPLVGIVYMDIDIYVFYMRAGPRILTTKFISLFCKCLSCDHNLIDTCIHVHVYSIIIHM